MDLSSMIASSRGRALTEEEEYEIQQWQNGRDLSQITHLPGWEVVLSMLKSYSDDATEKLLTTDPGNVDEVRAAHATAYAARRIVILFQEDALRAVEASRKTPGIVSSEVRKFSEVPPESLV